MNRIIYITFIISIYVISSIGLNILKPSYKQSKNQILSLSKLANFDYTVNNKLPWISTGYNKWIWNNNEINYVDLGGDISKQPLILIHGFGASVYHWRYNIPELAKNYHVFALDLLGFGLSDKPIIDYDAEIWRDQVLAFIEEVVFKVRNDKSPCVVAGNSLGGFTALYAASYDNSNSSNHINGCILINAAGRFRAVSPPKDNEEENSIVKWIVSSIQRLVINISFIYTKQPARIEQILRQVYPVNSNQVDTELVESIQYPSLHPNAAEVFYRVISKNGNGPPVYIDDLLPQLKVPLLLLWGVEDPWIRPRSADLIQQLYKSAIRVDLDAGHCPHDEAPERVNEEIIKFISTINSNSKLSDTVASLL